MSKTNNPNEPNPNGYHKPVFTPNIITSKLEGGLIELAAELAYNYFSNSFGDDYNMHTANCEQIFKNFEIGTISSKYFKGRFERGERVRNILVVGAGVSYDAYKAIPTGEDLVEEIKHDYEGHIKAKSFLKNKFEQQEEEIKDITGLPKLTFENYLYLLSKLFVTQTDLREKIKDMTGLRYAVSLFNEIVAHLLKHAFIDVVVNFNFEETLDQVIHEEIGSDNYHNIISDGNCVALEQILVDGRLKMPVYIKPHGTHSHKSTLRFTNRHYFDLPNDIKVMLQGLVRGTVGDKKKIERVNLIFVGFAVNSIEFNKIIDSELPEQSVIYHIDYKPFKTAAEFFEEKKFKTFLGKAKKHSRPIEKCYKPISTAGFNQNMVETGNSLTSPLGELFSVLWRIQNDFFKKAYKPRSIARHEITSYLFYLPEYGLQRTPLRNLKERIKERKFIQQYIENHPKYYRDRVLIELFLVLNRSNGILDVAEILKGRTGIYYNKYLAACKNGTPRAISGTHSIFELLDVFTKQPDRHSKMLLDTEEYHIGKNVFTLQSDFTSSLFEDRTLFESHVDNLTSKLISNSFIKIHVPEKCPLPLKTIPEMIQQFETNFKSMLMNWFDDTEVSVSMNEKLRFGRTITLFLRLFQHKHLSNFFKYNFLLNNGKEVFNGNNVPGDSVFQREKPIMLVELFRLLNKSYNNHYYIIDSKPSNPVHHLWESFSRRKAIHTNVGRSAEFNHLFLEKDWDILLTVTETGSLLDFLHYEKNTATKQFKADLQEKHFIIICSYETIRQLYPEAEKPEDVLQEHIKHIRTEFSDGEFFIDENKITVLALPFNQHNHHFSIFLESLAIKRSSINNIKYKSTIITNCDNLPGKQHAVDLQYIFNAIGSMYIYRNGFSNHIDPVYIGMEDQGATTDYIYRDQVKLIEMFITHMNRAFKFEYFHRIKDEKIWEKPPMVKVLQEEWEANKNSEIEKDRFLTNLHLNLK
jgi:hypothetical protein